MTIDLAGSPYNIEKTGRWVLNEAARVQQRADLLRDQGRLSEQTLRTYFGDRRFEQIAESNAIEGEHPHRPRDQVGSRAGHHDHWARPGTRARRGQSLEGFGSAGGAGSRAGSDRHRTGKGTARVDSWRHCSGRPLPIRARPDRRLAPHSRRLVARDHDCDGGLEALVRRERRGARPSSRHRSAHVAHPHPPVHRRERPDITDRDEPRVDPGRSAPRHHPAKGPLSVLRGSRRIRSRRGSGAGCRIDPGEGGRCPTRPRACRDCSAGLRPRSGGRNCGRPKSAGSRSGQQWRGIGHGPSIFWSIPDESGYRKWIRDDSKSPGVAEFTLELPNVDRWIARLPGGAITRLPPSEIARRVAMAAVESISDS